MTDLEARIRDQMPRRLGALREAMDQRSVGLFLSPAPATQTYLAGFRALLYSRPILLAVTSDTTRLVVPGLEEAHARRDAIVDEVCAYYEHARDTGRGSHEDWLDEVIDAAGPHAQVGLELGASSARLAQRLIERGRSVVDFDSVLTSMRAVKDSAEIAAIREAARVTTVGVEAAVNACAVGRTEIEIDGAGTMAVLAEVARSSRPVTVEELVMTPSGVERSVLPHALSTTRRLEHGDGLIHTRQVGLDGYRAELERTLVVARATADQRRAFDAMRFAQEAAICAVRSGVRCGDIDAAAVRVFEDAGLGAHVVHRTGHGIGLAPHEPPYLRHGDPTPLAQGMVITIEPGIYVPGLGGFRHSDTVLVGADGAERLTAFGSALEQLTR